MKADRGSIETSNAGISGAFNISSLLVLATTNAPVDADIGLSSVDASKPELVITTTNGYAFSNILEKKSIQFNLTFLSLVPSHPGST